MVGARLWLAYWEDSFSGKTWRQERVVEYRGLTANIYERYYKCKMGSARERCSIFVTKGRYMAQQDKNTWQQQKICDWAGICDEILVDILVDGMKLQSIPTSNENGICRKLQFPKDCAQ